MTSPSRSFRSTTCVLMVAALMFLLLSSRGLASGFRIVDQSPRAIGQADAFVAQADDPSAIYYNPAGLTQVSNGVLAGFSIIRPTSKYKDPSGQKESSLDRYYYPPFFYLVHDLGIKDWRFGLGVYSPFGLGVDWNSQGFSRYWSTRSRLEMLAVNPTVAVEVSPGLSLGAGASFFYSELTSARHVPLVGEEGPIPGMDGYFKSIGYGDGWGYNLGALYRFLDDHSLGLSFRSKASVKHQGNARVSGIPLAPGIMGTVSDRFRTTIDLPASVTFGYAWRPVPELKLEANVDWTGWKTFRELEFTFSGENPMFEDATIPRNWRDAWFYALGADWQLSTCFSLRGGVGYMESPVPRETFDTIIPRTDQFALALGGGYQHGSFSFDLAYLGAFGRRKQVENEVGLGVDLDGSYRTINHLVSASVAFNF